jgi:hypothetical protein
VRNRQRSSSPRAPHPPHEASLTTMETARPRPATRRASRRFTQVALCGVVSTADRPCTPIYRPPLIGDGGHHSLAPHGLMSFPTLYAVVAYLLRLLIRFPYMKNRYGKGNMASVRKPSSAVAHWYPRRSYICTPKSGKAAMGQGQQHDRRPSVARPRSSREDVARQ